MPDLLRHRAARAVSPRILTGMPIPIAPDQIRAILHHHDPALVLHRAGQPGQGIANETYLIETNRVSFVLKRYPAAVASWKPRKEQAVFAHLRQLGLPAPAMVAWDTTHQAVPFAWSLTRQVRGTPWSELMATLDHDTHLHLYRQLGNHLGRLHTTTFAAFGELTGSHGKLVVDATPLSSPAVISGPYARWVDMHRDIVTLRLRQFPGTMFESLTTPVTDYMDRHEHLIAGHMTPRLLHMDLHHGNILIENGNISALLDVEEAIAGHNEYDLMRTELAHFRNAPPAFEQAFLHAYHQHVPPDQAALQRRLFYETSRMLAWITSLLTHGQAWPPATLTAYQREARRDLARLVLA